MLIAVLKLLILLVLLFVPMLLAARQLGMTRAFGALDATLIIAGVAGLLTPHWESIVVQAVLVLVLVLLISRIKRINLLPPFSLNRCGF